MGEVISSGTVTLYSLDFIREDILENQRVTSSNPVGTVGILFNTSFFNEVQYTG